jgi:TonB family protein
MGIALQIELRKDGAFMGRVAPHRVPVIVGSARTADIYLQGDKIIARHCEITPGPGHTILVRDLGGGFAVNGMRLKHAEIRSGDEITIGPYRLHVLEAHVTSEVVDPDKYIHQTYKAESGAAVVELISLWRGKVREIHHISMRESGVREFLTGIRSIRSDAESGRMLSYTLGTRPGVDQIVQDGLLGDRKLFALLNSPEPHRCFLDLNLEGLTGEVRLADGNIVDVAQARQETGGKLAVTPGVRARLDLGPFSFLVSGTQLPQKPKGIGMSRESAFVALMFALSFLGHSGFMLGLTLFPEDAMSLSRTSYRNEYGVAGMMKLAQEAKPPEPKEKVKPERVKARKATKDPGDDAKKNSRNKSAMVDKLSLKERAERDKTLARSTGLNKAMEQQSALLEEALEAGLDSDANKKLAALMPPDPNSRGPESDMGTFRGDSTGGPGASDGGITGSGSLANSGMGGTGGPGVDGLSKVDISGQNVDARMTRKARRAIVKEGKFNVSGGYDKSIIRAYIRRHLRQLQWCHQKAIQIRPNVAGKVTVRFLINPSGKVMKAKVVHSTVNDKGLETCLAQKIQMWNFPPPPNAGVTAVVTYPFHFKIVNK